MGNCILSVGNDLWANFSVFQPVFAYHSANRYTSPQLGSSFFSNFFTRIFRRHLDFDSFGRRTRGVLLWAVFMSFKRITS